MPWTDTITWLVFTVIGLFLLWHKPKQVSAEKSERGEFGFYTEPTHNWEKRWLRSMCHYLGTALLGTFGIYLFLNNAGLNYDKALIGMFIAPFAFLIQDRKYD